jgi:TonB family protein
MANVLLPLADPVDKSGAVGGRGQWPPSTVELNLLPPWERRRSRREWTWIFSASIALHVLLFLVALQLPGPAQISEEQHTVTYKRIILYMPPSLMTQKAPNRRQLSKQIDLSDLLASQSSQARRATPAFSRRHFELPKQSFAPQPNAKNTQALPNAPQVALNQAPASLPAGLPNSPLAPAPPPPSPVQNPFQDVGSEPTPNAHPTLAPPRSGVAAAINGTARDANSRDIVIADDSQTQAMPGSPWAPSANGGPHSAVELQSDPQNADFRPYLARILAIVRANWRRVIPESVRMGQLRGRTVIEFIIDRDGNIPKLVTADSSGYEPLDRAAVAGLSMSNPLPPLPADFKGFQVRLAFTFAYNMPSQ